MKQFVVAFERSEEPPYRWYAALGPGLVYIVDAPTPHEALTKLLIAAESE